MSVRNNRLPPPRMNTASKMPASKIDSKKTWASVVSGKPPKPKTEPKAEAKPEEKKMTQKELDELLQWAEENGYRDDGGCDAHDRIGCAECAFNRSGVCPSSKEEGEWVGGRWMYW